MRLRALHTTRYEYPTTAIDSHNEARLEPLSDEDQTCVSFSIKTTPFAKMFMFDLPTGRVHHFGIKLPHRTLTITAESVVETHLYDPFSILPLDSSLDDFTSFPLVKNQYAEYLTQTKRAPFYPEVANISRVVEGGAGRGVLEFVQQLNWKLFHDLTYSPGTTDVDSPLQQVLDTGMGVCQDFAHLMLAVCRFRGIPARYVSGYLYTGHQDHQLDVSNSRAGSENEQDQNEEGEEEERELVSGDAMHAWVECLLPDGRWHGYDPTNNVLTGHRYIKVHIGRDYGDVPPLRGVFKGAAAQKLEVSVRVFKIVE